MRSSMVDVVVFGLNGLQKSSQVIKDGERAVYFLKKMKTKLSCHKLVVPDEFSTAFGKYMRKPITLAGLNDEEAIVHWSCTREWENLTFNTGWETFVNLHNIRRNDLLIFRFDWSNVMTVDVLRSDTGSIDHFHGGYTPDPSDINNGVFELFRVTLNESFEGKKQPLYVPVSVARGHFGNEPEMIQVRLPSGELQMWEMVYSVERNECKIRTGWYEFKKEHNLQPGNVVKFGRHGMRPWFLVDFE